MSILEELKFKSWSRYTYQMDGMSPAFQVLTAMITPAVLISACGTLIFSTSARLGRVVDRVRAVSEKLTKAVESGGKLTSAEELLLEQFPGLSRRVLLLRSAMTCLYLSTGLFVATSISIGVITISRSAYEWVSVVMALVGSFFLLIGSILLISEARHAVTATLREMNYVREKLGTRMNAD